jgi:pyridoxal phosphate enzyme (YggS family)
MSSEEPAIAENLGRVRSRVAAAAQRVGREPGSVRVVAVTKGQPLERVRQAYALGVRDLGENRVEEAIPRQRALEDLPGLRWHMIGHVQSRKARDVPSAFVLVHSVDRWKIAQAFDRYAAAAGQSLPVLLECNVSGEATKEGWAFSDRAGWDAMLREIEAVCSLQRLRVLGLMTMAPWTDRPEAVRPVFVRLRELRDFLAARLPGPWNELSMGMTDDFEVAIEEGATIVRIGRAIFGERVEITEGLPVVG